MLGFAPISDQPISSVPGSAAGTAYTITCDVAAFVVSAQDASLIRGRVVTADAAAFAVAAQDASLIRGRVVTAEPAAFTLAGQDASLIRGRVVTAEPAAFVVDAQDATLIYSPGGTAYTIVCDAAEFTIAAQDADLIFTPAATDGGGGRYPNWQPYWIDKRDWEKKIPPAVVQAIERIARKDTTEEKALRLLEAELDTAQYQARYAQMLKALMRSQFESLQALRRQQLADFERLERDEEDSIMLLM